MVNVRPCLYLVPPISSLLRKSAIRNAFRLGQNCQVFMSSSFHVWRVRSTIERVSKATQISQMPEEKALKFFSTLSAASSGLHPLASCGWNSLRSKCRQQQYMHTSSTQFTPDHCPHLNDGQDPVQPLVYPIRGVLVALYEETVIWYCPDSGDELIPESGGPLSH